MAFFESIIATLFVSALSLVGIVFVVSKAAEKNIGLLVSFAAGTMLSVVFFDVLPEALEAGGSLAYALLGIIAFFLLEKILFWHHHHSKIHHHPVTTLNLVGDAIHNFLDGTIIAASFIQDTALGVTTTIAIAAHEIPQEFGDYTILIYGGFSKRRALLFNLLSALCAVVGAISVFYLSSLIPNLSAFLLPFAAGGFIYIACTDLIPELKKERALKKSILEFLSFLAGIGVIWVIVSVFE